MIIDYDIISSRSKEKMITLVKEKIADGWRPLGGHIHAVYEEEVELDVFTEDREGNSIYTELRTTGCWSQSMIKGDSNELHYQ